MVRTSCARFEPNQFNRLKCQNCFKPKREHSDETLENFKMKRKVTICGTLYVAPPNVDFSIPSHSVKRWQRRYFALYDTGELTYSLDNNPDTVPQVTMEMCSCTRVCEADSITGHAHSILIAFEGHVCYVKADTTDEIRLWQSMLSVFVKQNLLQASPRRGEVIKYEPITVRTNCAPCLENTVQSGSSSPSLDAFDMKDDLEIERDIRSGTIRKSSDTTQDLYSIRSSQVNNATIVELEPRVDYAPPPPPPVTQVPQEPKRTPFSTPFHIDTSHAHTLRKGWLMLRGKSDREWNKHWVVLAGLSLKLYKDVWAEDSTEPLLSIDLAECDNVYPSASAKNYGIEIKCRRTRYVLSAMTPGIRDSWIDALKHNLHNPSPSYAETCASNDALSLADSNDVVGMPMRKKHIAYVAPESHHSNSMMSEESISADERNHSDSNHSSASSRSRQKHRRRDVSPAVQRSPVSRVKEKNAEGRIRNGSGSSVSSISQKKPRSTKKNTRTKGADFEVSATIEKLEAQVSSLREQLDATVMRLGDSLAENERLHAINNANDPTLAALRKSLSAAEADIREKQKEYEDMKRRLASPSPVDNHHLGEFRHRLISMLKIQVAVLSKCISSRWIACSRVDYRHKLDDLTNTIDKVDKLQDECDLETINNLMEDVTVLYDQVEQRFHIPVTRDVAENTDFPDDSYELDYTKNDKEWEAEVVAMKNAHQSEMEALHLHYEHQLKIVRERLENEEKKRKKATDEVLQMTTMGDQKVIAVRSSYEEMLEEQKKSFEEEIQVLKKEHVNELNEEKQATRIALEAVRRAHEDELRLLEEKGVGRSCDASRDAQRQSRLLEQMREELTGLSALYSAKCIENAQLDERIAEMAEDAEKQSEERSRLESELREKEEQLKQLRDTISHLESSIANNETGTASDQEEQPSHLQSAAQLPSVASPSAIDHCATSEKDNSAVRFRKSQKYSRRTDVRFHSNPVIPVGECVPEFMLDELRRSLAVPVAERRKFFETIAEYSTPF